jgi:hypothetical protein
MAESIYKSRVQKPTRKIIDRKSPGGKFFFKNLRKSLNKSNDSNIFSTEYNNTQVEDRAIIYYF